MFGNILTKLRKKKGLSQYDLAVQLGLSRGQISNYELGTRLPDYDTLIKIADYFGVTTDYLLGLTDKTYDENKRNLLSENRNEYKTIEPVKIPVYKLDGAGEIFAEKNIIDWRDVPAKHMNSIAFQVSDDSMSGIRLYPGDLVLVTKQDTAEDGQVIVVKLNDGPAFIRRIKYSNDVIILYPENPSFDSEVLTFDRLKIIGIVTEAMIKVK